MLSYSPVLTHSLTHSFTAPTVRRRMEGRIEQKYFLVLQEFCNFSIPKDGGCDQEPLSSSWVKLGDPREGKTVQGFYNCFHLFYGSLAPKWT